MSTSLTLHSLGLPSSSKRQMPRAKAKKVALTTAVAVNKPPNVKRTTRQDKAKDATTLGRLGNRNAGHGLVSEEPEGPTDSSIRHAGADMPDSSQSATGLVAAMTGWCESPEVLLSCRC
jgi:hypothetical protein